MTGTQRKELTSSPGQASILVSGDVEIVSNENQIAIRRDGADVFSETKVLRPGDLVDEGQNQGWYYLGLKTSNGKALYLSPDATWDVKKYEGTQRRARSLGGELPDTEAGDLIKALVAQRPDSALAKTFSKVVGNARSDAEHWFWLAEHDVVGAHIQRFSGGGRYWVDRGERPRALVVRS